MDNLLRLLLRFILVPLGFLAATTVVVVGHWRAIVDLAGAGDPATFFGAVLPLLVLLWTVVAAIVLPLACIGVLIAEVFAVRSWIYHGLNGAVSSALGWVLLEPVRAQTKVPLELGMLVGAGVAAGLTYWLIAGFSAGFWKPVFRTVAPAAPTPLPAERPRALPPTRPA